MSLSRLSILFERKARHTKSTSNLSEAARSQSQPQPWKKPKSKERVSSLEYTLDRFSIGKRHETTPSCLAVTTVVNPTRVSGTPRMYPPDELFLKTVRRRSANARLEEQRIQSRRHQIQRYHSHPDTIPTPVAVAHALPPQYLDLPPEYESPQQTTMSPPIQTRATIVRPKDPELFLDDTLKTEIDQVIAEYQGFRLTEATPVLATTPIADDGYVSPINEIDALYLRRRREERHRQTRRVEIFE